MPSTANEITVLEVLNKFDGDFSAVAKAVENGEFSLWVGSGISRQAPDLGKLIERAFDHVRERAISGELSAEFRAALKKILQLAEIDLDVVPSQINLPLSDWPERDTIIGRLWNQYSRVLDVRIEGKPADYILWEAIDIREAFAAPSPPAAEHLCIAILILEGALQTVASANWDGFIETAVERLSGGVPNVLQVVVDPAQLRSAPGRAKLLKFHGCIVHATDEPDTFRRHLIGSHPQITRWPFAAEFAAMRNQIIGLATNSKTLVMGLSIQDANLQQVFAQAAEVNAWPWPCEPEAMAQVFCENEIQQGQRDVLSLVYGDDYNENLELIHSASLLRAWGEKVLIALVLKLLTDKLTQLADLSLSSIGKSAIAAELSPSLVELRNDIARLATPSGGPSGTTPFVNEAISLWSRALSVFRTGRLPTNAEAYETLSSSTPPLIAADQNLMRSGLDKLGVALALLQRGKSEGLWQINIPSSDGLGAGSLSARAVRHNAFDRPLFLVSSATEAIALKSQGAIANDNAVVIHGDNVFHEFGRTGKTARRARGAPGRTGKIQETHISLGALLEDATDAAGLHQAFIEEMLL